MSEQEAKTEEIRHIRFLGNEGGETTDEDGRTFLTMGVYTGNLWKMALDYKHPKFHLNSMLCSMFGSYSIPHQLMQTFYNAEFENEKNGLHARITFKDAETRNNVKEVMKAQRALDDALEKFDTDDWTGHYTNKHYIEHMRLIDEITNAIESMWWIVEILVKDSTTIEYDYEYEEDRRAIMETDSIRHAMEKLLIAYESIGGEYTIGMYDEEE